MTGSLRDTVIGLLIGTIGGVVCWLAGIPAPWLAGSLDTLAPDAPRVVLMDLPGTTLFEARDWGHEEDGEHGHGGTDAHAWLDPENAKLWLGVLAETLAKADPEHAAEYRANADAGRAGIDAAAAEVLSAVRALGPAPVLVYHDAFQYLEHSFGLEVLGAISGEDGAETGPAQLEALRDAAEARGAHCVLIEPQFSTRRIDAVFGAGRFDVAVIDPLGTSDAGAPGQYAQMLRGVAAALADCL